MKQRRFPRMQLDSKVFLRTPDRSFSADSLNFTLQGIFIKTREKVETGTIVEVDITIPCTTRNPNMKLQGIVARVENSGLAIEFTRMDPEIFQCLKNIILRRSTHRHKPYIAP
ncbi:MAG: PilZ domain-containing protein [Geobacteraceae bacterium]